MDDLRKEIADLLAAARHVIDGRVDSRTPEYAALDNLERALSLLVDMVRWHEHGSPHDRP